MEATDEDSSSGRDIFHFDIIVILGIELLAINGDGDVALGGVAERKRCESGEDSKNGEFHSESMGRTRLDSNSVKIEPSTTEHLYEECTGRQEP